MDRREPELTSPSAARRCAVIGSPVAHSASPDLHRAAYRHLGLNWRYDAITVAENEVAAFVDGLDRSWRGLSVTMPLKQAVVDLASDLLDPVPAVGVANTLLLEPHRRVALNTDVCGMRAAVVEAGVDRLSTATVLGGGSTARAALAALAGLADEVTVCVRTPSRARTLRDVAEAVGVDVRVAAWSQVPVHLGAPLVVSTTPAGATDEWVEAVPASPGLLFDVVYKPWPTPVASAWSARGGRVLGGLDLLVHQAAGQVVAMTGQDVPIGVLRAAVAARR